MAGRKRAGSKRGASIEPESSQATVAIPTIPELPTPTSSKIPDYLQFPALVALNFLISLGLQSAFAPYTSGDLSIVSAQRDEWWEILAVLLWKVIELAIGWWAGYDAFDLASLTTLTHAPYLFFITSFYKIGLTTATILLFVDTISITTPFYILRSILAPHRSKPPKGSVVNRLVLDDIQGQAANSLFASVIHAVVVFTSFQTWMPTYLVVHFEGIKDITSIYRSDFVWMVLPFVPIGIAAKTFLFTPSIAAKSDARDKEIEFFNAESATLSETILYNLWGHSKRVKTLQQRTATLAVLVGLHTWLHTYIVVEGAEAFGAAGWSSIWVVATALTGLSFAWVGNV